MCGIIGCMGTNYASSLPLNELMHRGPDASDTWTNNKNCILGHTRLSIIDLNPRSDQPMTDPSGRFTLVYNGELYNYLELSKTYLAGVQLSTTSDTEVLLHLWKKLGRKCLLLLRGMYAFAIWDNHNDVLHLVRDRLGQKPLYYYKEGNRLVFASELNALSKLHGKMDISIDGIDLFLGNQFIPTPHTIYKDVYKLPAASFAEWKNDKLTVKSYYEMRFDHKAYQDITESNAKDLLEDKIVDSVKLRLRSDVPVGCLLSGGVDSSIVTAIASRISKKKIKTYSIGFSDSEFSELEYARIVSNLYNTDHTEHIFNEDDALTLLDKSIEQYGEPFGDKSSLASLLVCSLASKDVPVVLSGDGGDELLGGYTKYRLDFRHKILSLLPIHTNAYHQVADKLQYIYSPNNPTASDLVSKIIRFMEPLSGVTRFNEFFTPYHMKQFYNEDFYHDIMTVRRDHISNMIHNLQPDNHILNKMLSLDHKNYFTDDLLVKMDIASMAYSLEVRSPLLDSNLMEFAASLPIHFKQQAGSGKYLLKKLAESYLPHDLIYRQKQGFAIPVAKWLNGRLREPLDEILSSGKYEVWNYLNRKAILQLYDNGQGITKNASRFWLLLILALWLKRRNRP